MKKEEFNRVRRYLTIHINKIKNILELDNQTLKIDSDTKKTLQDDLNKLITEREKAIMMYKQFNLDLLHLQSVSIEKELTKELKEKIIKNKGNIVSIFNLSGVKMLNKKRKRKD